MNLVLYANSKNGAGERLQEVIELMAPQEQVETFITVDGLDRKLRQPVHGVGIAVLLATSKKELLELYSLKDLLNDVKIILILPDSESETTTLAHKLWPRFTSYLDSDFKDVGAVLRKMIEHMKSKYFFLDHIVA